MTNNATDWLLTFKWTPTADPDPDRQELILYRLQDRSGLLSEQPDGTWHVSVVLTAGAGADDAIGLATRIVLDATGATSAECRLIDSQPLSGATADP